MISGAIAVAVPVYFVRCQYKDVVQMLIWLIASMAMIMVVVEQKSQEFFRLAPSPTADVWAEIAAY